MNGPSMWAPSIAAPGELEASSYGAQEVCVALRRPGDGGGQEGRHAGLRQFAAQSLQSPSVRSHVNPEGTVYLQVNKARTDKPRHLATLRRQLCGPRRAHDIEDPAILDHHRCPAYRLGCQTITD